MPRLNSEWTVGPHGPVERLDEGLLTVAAEIRMPLGNFPRRMTAVALDGNRAAIWSPVPLREEAMRDVEALGAPAFLIVPGAAHRLDIRAWRRRYPDARVICPPGAWRKVEEAVPVDAGLEALQDPDVRLEAVPGTGDAEAAMRIRRGPRTTLVLNDILANVRHPHGLGAQLMARLFGFGVKRPRTPRPVRRMLVQDARALARGFRAWAAEPGLARIVVSHGEVIEEGCADVLAQAAADLEG